MGPLRLKIRPCKPGIDPPEPVNRLLSLNINSERLQYLIVRIENGPQNQGGGEISPLSSALAATLETSEQGSHVCVARVVRWCDWWHWEEEES